MTGAMGGRLPAASLALAQSGNPMPNGGFETVDPERWTPPASGS